MSREVYTIALEDDAQETLKFIASRKGKQPHELVADWICDCMRREAAGLMLDRHDPFEYDNLQWTKGEYAND